MGGDFIYWLENKFKFLERFKVVLLCLIAFLVNGNLFDVSLSLSQLTSKVKCVRMIDYVCGKGGTDKTIAIDIIKQRPTIHEFGPHSGLGIKKPRLVRKKESTKLTAWRGTGN